MQARILFLGTGGDAIVIGRQMRASGGIILQVEDNQFHIDPGPGSLVMALKHGVNVRANTALLVTKNRINHCNDVNAVIDAMTYSGMDRKGVLVCHRSLYDGTEEARPFLTDYHRGLVERSIPVEPGQKVGINDVDIHITASTNRESMGLKFFTSKFTLGYTGDTDMSSGVAEQYRGVNVLILNVPLPDNAKKEGQLNAESAASFIKVVKPSLAIITHFGVKMLHEDPLQAARDISRETKTQTIAATDGQSIDPLSYSAELKTKTLNLY